MNHLCQFIHVAMVPFKSCHEGDNPSLRDPHEYNRVQELANGLLSMTGLVPLYPSEYALLHEWKSVEGQIVDDETKQPVLVGNSSLNIQQALPSADLYERAEYYDYVHSLYISLLAALDKKCEDTDSPRVGKLLCGARRARRLRNVFEELYDRERSGYPDHAQMTTSAQ